MALVFFCRQCQTIVGDSWAFVQSDAELRTVILQVASNVVVDRSKSETVQGRSKDTGCTFHKVSCGTCKTAIGRLYITTTPDLDHTRHTFSFFVDSLSSYTLGSGNAFEGARKKDEPSLLESFAHIPTLSSQHFALKNVVDKIQKAIVQHNQRLEIVESQVGSASVDQEMRGAPRPDHFS